MVQGKYACHSDRLGVGRESGDIGGGQWTLVKRLLFEKCKPETQSPFVAL